MHTVLPMDRSDDARAQYWQQLLHRWFVQYNPIYLVSAMLVLGGTIVTSQGLAHDGSVFGPLGVALIAELYAGALIGGAALLTRIGQRRPAVLLALITVLYQADVTLHTETCALLGTVGIVASVAWLALFVIKLRALAWAVRIRVSRRAFATAIAGACGMTAAPYALVHLDAESAGAAVAVFVLVLGSLVPRSAAGHDAAATSLFAADAWHATVLRRAVRATWILWGTLLAGHVLFWSMQHRIQLWLVVPALGLLALGRVRTESRFWVAIAAILAGAFVAAPAALSATALLATIALVQRAAARVVVRDRPAHDAADVRTEERSPYRIGEEPRERVEADSLAHLPRPERLRLVAGALFTSYLALWTMGWASGPLPAHVLLLDLALTVGVALVVWRHRARFALAPLAATWAHALAAAGLVPRPHSQLEWGVSAVSLGFLLLVASLVASYRLRHVTPVPDRPQR